VRAGNRDAETGDLPAAFSGIPAKTLKEVSVVLLWILVALLLLFAIVGGVALSKFLFFILIVAAVVALIGFFARTA
jgi:hypothetical protein